MIKRDGDCLWVQAPMTMGTARSLLEAGNPLFDGGVRVVDLSGVAQADSSGLAVLLEWLRLTRVAGASLAFTGIPAGLAALADLYDLSETFPHA